MGGSLSVGYFVVRVVSDSVPRPLASGQLDAPATQPSSDEFPDLEERLIEQANATRWVWQEHQLSIVGPTVGYPKQWLEWGKKLTNGFESAKAASEALTAADFIQIGLQFGGPDLIPTHWRPADGAWAHLCDGPDGHEVCALDRDGNEIALHGEPLPEQPK